MRAPLFLLAALGLLGGLSTVVAGPPALPKDPADLSKAFEHDTHLKQLVKAGDRVYSCNDCHAQPAKKGEEGKQDFPICVSTRMPFPLHDKCITCHPTAFFQKPLQICTNCHVDVAITKESALKSQSGAMAPLRTVFDHNLHLDPSLRVKKKFGFNKDCSYCHEFQKGGDVVGKPHHAECCECHTKKDVQPSINDCSTCHSRPKSERLPVSMIKKFSHKEHKLDPSTNSSLPCQRCHENADKAKTLTSMQLPTMATCVTCHQGEVAFSYADCLKCHEKGIELKLVPQTHKDAVERGTQRKKPQ